MRHRNPDLLIAQRLLGVAEGVMSEVRKTDSDLGKLDLAGVARVTNAIAQIRNILGEAASLPTDDPEIAETIGKIRACGLALQSAVRAAQGRFSI